MNDLIDTPFSFTDQDGNALVVDRQTNLMAFHTLDPNGNAGPTVRIPLSSLALVFSHLITQASATPTTDGDQP